MKVVRRWRATYGRIGRLGWCPLCNTRLLPLIQQIWHDVGFHRFGTLGFSRLLWDELGFPSRENLRPVFERPGDRHAMLARMSRVSSS
jgi:hypothetical protein